MTRRPLHLALGLRYAPGSMLMMPTCFKKVFLSVCTVILSLSSLAKAGPDPGGPRCWANWLVLAATGFTSTVQVRDVLRSSSRAEDFHSTGAWFSREWHNLRESARMILPELPGATEWKHS